MDLTYSKSIPLTGQSDLAMQAAMAILTGQGFLVTSRQDHAVEFQGPKMISTRQPPIFGASQIRVSSDHGQLTLAATLGGVAKMRRFLIWLPLLMAVGMAVVIGGVLGVLLGQAQGVGFGAPFAPGWNWVGFATLVSVLPLSPWLVLSPVLIRSLRARTVEALDTCLSNINVMSQA